jgi:aspartyl protease family protein
MERKLALWLGVPFVGVAWTLTAIVALVPGLRHGRLLMLLLLALAMAGLVFVLFRMAARHRASGTLIDTLYPIAGILLALVLAFHEQVGAVGRNILGYATHSDGQLEGMRFARAEDGQFHARLMIDGNAVEFLVDMAAPFNVLMPDVPRRIGIDPSSLVYGQRVDLATGGVEYTADIVLPKAQLGTATIEHLPAKVFATQRWRNVLGKPFLESLKDWRIDGDTLILVP